MSVQGVSLWQCVRSVLCSGVLLLAFALDFTTGRRNCSHPLVPEHGGFRCDPSPCRGFPHKGKIRYFCEPGFYLPKNEHVAHCNQGTWTSSPSACAPILGEREVQHRGSKGSLPKEPCVGDGSPVDRDEQTVHSVATTAVGVSIFLLTTTVCMVIKSRLHPCHSQRRSSDQLDLVIDGFPVLPSYEEAVYGSWGERIPPSQGPTQLLLAQEQSGPHPQTGQPQTTVPFQPANQTTDLQPPPYEEVQSDPRGDERGEGQREIGQALRIIVSSDKDN
ncbi:sushi domain-containing protein 6 isoform X2 [Amia ocellicauda]|uniref:sushi domain-containing protein 6 isoform X2 n=1 Tax=Amia ocellicauda TaxID=2972642 RepID=UPI003464872D